MTEDKAANTADETPTGKAASSYATAAVLPRREGGRGYTTRDLTPVRTGIGYQTK